jgi:hypothetical protein
METGVCSHRVGLMFVLDRFEDDEGLTPVKYFAYKIQARVPNPERSRYSVRKHLESRAIHVSNETFISELRKFRGTMHTAVR